MKDEKEIKREIFEKRERLIIRNPNFIRPWQYVLEPLYGYMLLAKKLYEDKKNFSGPWNFGPSNANYLTVKKLLEKTLKRFNKESYIIKRDFTKHEAECLKLNIDKARNILGWRPILNLDQTLELAFDWYETFYSKKDVISLTDQQIKSFFRAI